MVLAKQAINARSRVCVAMTAEDADDIGFGMVHALEDAGVRVSVACFWNDQSAAADGPYGMMAPVIQEYVEPLDGVDQIVMVSSMLSDSCVVRTNLVHLMDEIRPCSVHVAAPVMLQGADERLGDEFPPEIAGSFHFWTFEVDKDRAPEGEVYGSLGLRDGRTKNWTMPALVAGRSRAAA